VRSVNDGWIDADAGPRRRAGNDMFLQPATLAVVTVMIALAMWL
jgi:hypothetical protein